MLYNHKHNYHDMKKILFICTHNSARSQMAEGLTNYYYSDTWEAFSAGLQKTYVKSYAIDALRQIGVDISHHTSKTIDEFMDTRFDMVVTVCDSAKETCPYFPNADKLIHAGFEDPSDIEGDEFAKLAGFIKIRDEIKSWLDRNLA